MDGELCWPTRSPTVGVRLLDAFNKRLEILTEFSEQTVVAALCCVLGVPVILRAEEDDDGAKRDSGKRMKTAAWLLTRWNGGEVRMESASLRANSGEVAHADSLHKKNQRGHPSVRGDMG